MIKKSRVSPSLEDYLETIFFIYEKSNIVRVTDVAVEMSISKPSVNKAINNLKSQGLVEHEHYGLLNLTDKGFELAKSIAKKHIIIKTFLVDILGIEESVAEIEACQIEHSMSFATVEKLETHIDNLNKGGS